MDARESKLPRWARDELELLRMRLRGAEKRIEELNDGPVDANTIARVYGDHPQRLGRDELVQFRFDEEWTRGERFYVTAQVNRQREGSFLEVRGVEALAVRPQSSNVVQIWPVIR